MDIRTGKDLTITATAKNDDIDVRRGENGVYHVTVDDTLIELGCECSGPRSRSGNRPG